MKNRIQRRDFLRTASLAGIGIGLILDEFLFIMSKSDNLEYFSTIPSAMIFFIILIIIILLIKRYSK